MCRRWLSVAFLFFLPQFLLAGIITIDFEGFNDGDILTNQIPGLTFTNTAVLTAGFSLNEIDFPPHSGVNVVSDNGGPISIVFDTPVFGFAAYFTYVEPLSLVAFNASNTQVASASSLYSNNTGTAGDFGSSPNELLQVSSLAGISFASITGGPAGGSFVMDDVTLTTTVPEPSSLSLAVTGIGLASIFFLRPLMS
jgi:hypothetical protein